MEELKNVFKDEMICSIICPAYNEAENLPKLVEAITIELEKYSHEIIIVDDGSQDDSLSVLENLTTKYSNLKYVSFTRNFGHQNALMAGVKSASGNCLVMLDADLQHPPSLIPDMIEKWYLGYKVIQCVRKDEISSFKTQTSKWFYAIISMLSNVSIVPGTSDFRLIDRVVVDHLKQLDRPVFFRGYIPWLGYEICFLNYSPDDRYAGKTKFTLRKMIKLSLDGITTQSTFPLRLARYLGTLISTFAFIYLSYALYIHLFTERTVPGWASILISTLFLGGVQLIFLGVLGEYIGRIFERSYKKPIYQIKDHSGFDKENES